MTYSEIFECQTDELPSLYIPAILSSSTAVRFPVEAKSRRRTNACLVISVLIGNIFVKPV